jgi:hypothetical protein
MIPTVPKAKPVPTNDGRKLLMIGLNPTDGESQRPAVLVSDDCHWRTIGHHEGFLCYTKIHKSSD